MRTMLLLLGYYKERAGFESRRIECGEKQALSGLVSLDAGLFFVVLVKVPPSRPRTVSCRGRSSENFFQDILVNHNFVPTST